MTETGHRPPAAAIRAVPLIVALVLTLWPDRRRPPRRWSSSSPRLAVLGTWALAGVAAMLLARLAHGTLMRPVSSSA